MSYQFEENEAPEMAIRRVAVAELDGALSAVYWPDADAAVHDLRKRFKRLRALLRLAQGRVVGADRRERNDAYRDTARVLAAARDSRVLVDACELLGRRTLMARLQTRHQAHMDVFEAEGGIERIEPVLRAFRTDAQELPVRVTSWSDLHAGLTRIFRRGAAAHVTASTDPTSHNLHQWRKRVKDLWYANTLLLLGWPEITLPFNDALDDLANRLGEDHDLAVLAEVLEREPDLADGDATADLHAIHERRRELLSSVWPLGRRIYAEAAGAYATRTLAYWRSGSP